MPEKTSVSHIVTERAIDELRRQMGVIYQEDSAAVPVEFLDDALLADMRALPGARLFVLLTAARARSIALEPGEAKTVRIAADGLSLPQIQALADPLAEHERPAVAAEPASAAQHGLLQLTKYASLLPGMLLVAGDVAGFMPHWLHVAAQDIEYYAHNPLLGMVETAQASLPLEEMENTRILSFRAPNSTAVHLALVMGELEPGSAPLTRIHSSCVTGDILGSLRCDCGDQLKLALHQISEAGSGILVYLHQEGRGIGITNKLRAYRLQEQGFDTYEANLMLGFEEDERDFSIAANILRVLGVSRIRMLTNNPHKLAALEQAGIEVLERVGLIVKTGRHNHAYLDAKAKKSGHFF